MWIKKTPVSIQCTLSTQSVFAAVVVQNDCPTRPLFCCRRSMTNYLFIPLNERTCCYRDGFAVDARGHDNPFSRITAVSSRPDGVRIGFLDDTVIFCRAVIESSDPLTWCASTTSFPTCREACIRMSSYNTSQPQIHPSIQYTTARPSSPLPSLPPCALPPVLLHKTL